MIKLPKFLDKQHKFNRALLVGFLIVTFLAVMDAYMAVNFGDIVWQPEIIPAYMFTFWTFAYVMMGFLALSYYMFVRRDKSEAVAVGLFAYLLSASGVEDIIYYLVRGLDFVQAEFIVFGKMPWLEQAWFIGGFARIFGFETVTNVSLVLSAAVGFTLAYLLARWLKERW